jgi:DNA-binding MarR family transcriptional regulator/GNAT superfamily N-acetyltransferase
MSDNIVSAIRGFNREYLNRLRIFDTNFNTSFTVTETRLLYEVSLTNNATLKDLCDKLHLDLGYGSRVIKKFVEKGYIIKKADPKDKRTSFLSLSAEGKSVVEEINGVENQRINELFEQTAPDQKALFSHLLADALNIIAPSSEKVLPVIRTHKPGDLGMITHFHGKYYADNYGYSEVFEALVAKDFSEYILEFDKKKDVFYVVEFQGKVVGSLALQHRSNVSAQLRFFYLDPSLRGKGVGKALMNQVLDFAKRTKYKHLNLWTHKGLDSAHALYKKFGFVQVETKTHSLWKEGIEEQLWEKHFE